MVAFLMQKRRDLQNGRKQKIFGYARTSTREQNEDRQIIALKEMGVPEKNISLINFQARTLKDSSTRK